MGKRVYKGDDGQIYESAADARENENRHMLREAFAGIGFDLGDDVAIEAYQADALRAALRPYATKKTRTRKAKVEKVAKAA